MQYFVQLVSQRLKLLRCGCLKTECYTWQRFCATCLAKPGAVSLFPRNADFNMADKTTKQEHSAAIFVSFYWPQPRMRKRSLRGTLRDKLQKWVLHCATPLKSLQKVEVDSAFCSGSCNLSRNDCGRSKVCYTVQCFVRLVSQWRCETGCTKHCRV